jgi:hypothetical protein
MSEPTKVRLRSLQQGDGGAAEVVKKEYGVWRVIRTIFGGLIILVAIAMAGVTYVWIPIKTQTAPAVALWPVVLHAVWLVSGFALFNADAAGALVGHLRALIRG